MFVRFARGGARAFPFWDIPEIHVDLYCSIHHQNNSAIYGNPEIVILVHKRFKIYIVQSKFFPGRPIVTIQSHRMPAGTQGLQLGRNVSRKATCQKDSIIPKPPIEWHPLSSYAASALVNLGSGLEQGITVLGNRRISLPSTNCFHAVVALQFVNKFIMTGDSLGSKNLRKDALT